MSITVIIVPSRRHMDYLRSKFPNKSNALLQKQHCDDFGEWLKTEVEFAKKVIFALKSFRKVVG